MDKTNILDLIYALESSSGKNKAAYKPNSYGALGGYQIRPGAFEDIKRINPQWRDMSFEDVAMDDDLSRQAANDYMKVIQLHLVSQGIAPTMEALLSSYHGGMGNTARGTTGPNTQEYVSRARVMRGGMME